MEYFTTNDSANAERIKFSIPDTGHHNNPLLTDTKDEQLGKQVSMSDNQFNEVISVPSDLEFLIIGKRDQTHSHLFIFVSAQHFLTSFDMEHITCDSALQGRQVGGPLHADEPSLPRAAQVAPFIQIASLCEHRSRSSDRPEGEVRHFRSTYFPLIRVQARGTAPLRCDSPPQ